MKDKLIMWDDVELLDYIGKIENKYIPCYDDFEYCDNYTITKYSISESELEQFSEEELRLLDTQPASGTEYKKIFAKRYSDNLINRKNIYNTYYKELKPLVEKLELDVDKFWFLSLFILDFCESIFYQGESFKSTPLEQLYKLSQTIEQCQDEPMTLKFKCGKKSVELDSPKAIRFIAYLIDIFNEEANNEYLEMDKREDTEMMNYRLRSFLLNQREWKEGVDIISDSPIIAYFANMFLDFFDTQEQILSKRNKGVKHTKTEMELVSRLIYLMGLSTNKNWNDIECEYLKFFLKQYKNYRYPNNRSSVYPEFNI